MLRVVEPSLVFDRDHDFDECVKDPSIENRTTQTAIERFDEYNIPQTVEACASFGATKLVRRISLPHSLNMLANVTIASVQRLAMRLQDLRPLSPFHDYASLILMQST